MFKLIMHFLVVPTDFGRGVVIPPVNNTRFHEQRISSVTFTSEHLCGNVHMRVDDSSDFGLLGEQSSQNFCEILCLGC